MSDEIKVNSENTPRKNLATLGQVKDALDKRDEKIGSLKEDLNELKESGIGSGMTDTAKKLLITILENAVFTTNQSDNITALEEALISNESDTTVTAKFGTAVFGTAVFA